MNEENIKLINLISKLSIKKKKKAYSNELLNEFKNILLKGNSKSVIYFLLNKEINLGNLCPINYRNLIVLNKFKKDFNIEELEEYKLLDFFISEKIKNKDFIFFDFLRNKYQDNSKKKANLFKEVFLKEYKGKIKTIIGLENLNNIEEDFIFIPKQDEEINLILKRLEITLKSAKGRDVFIKYNNKFYIGEAKEINEVGGGQTNQFNDMLNCIEETNNNIIGIGIVYGLCLFYDNKYLEEIKSNKNIISFYDFIYNLENTLKVI